MHLYDFLPGCRLLRLLTVLVALFVAMPGPAFTGTARAQSTVTTGGISISFGQEMGNIRPFRVTITSAGSIQLAGPIHLANGAGTVSRDALIGLVLLARAEGIRALPSFMSCPGTLPDIAARYVNIRTPSWQHRASVRGSCMGGFNALFAVLMGTTRVSF